jgi:dTDP-4-dehydrorhamnose 3,5-epimerase
MIICETKLSGAYIIEPKRFEDERGFFASAWSEKGLEELGVESRFIGGNISFNKHRGTLRGLHFQAAPHGQAKLVRCTRGAIFDVGVDLRPDSPSYKQWFALELSADNLLMLYLPAEMAHGYLTLEDDCEVYYQVTKDYVPESNRGFRWNDPAFGITWPWQGLPIMNERDRTYPDFAG